jgi:hypothetical protein
MAEGFKGDFSLPLPAQLRLRVFFSRGANKQQQQKKAAWGPGSPAVQSRCLFIYLLEEEEVALFISGTRVGGWNVVPNPNAELHMDNCAIVC